MSEIKLSQRAQNILSYLSPSPDAGEGFRVRFIRQQSLADQFNCSRRTIGRALKELKDAGSLVDLNKRHENRCKMYEVVRSSLRAERSNPGDNWIAASAAPPRNDGLTPQAQLQWEKFEKTFRIVFKMPELPMHYAQVTRELAGVKEESELWTKTFAGLWAMGL